MSFRIATLCCFLVLVALATSAKITTTKKPTTTMAVPTTMAAATTEEVTTPTTEPSTTTTTTPEPTTVEETTTEEITTTTPIPITEKSLLSFCNSMANGNYVNPFECKTFILCSNEIAYVMNCPPNLVYNQQSNSCDYSYNVPGC